MYNTPDKNIQVFTASSSSNNSYIPAIPQQSVSRFLQFFCLEDMKNCVQNMQFLNHHAIAFTHYLSRFYPNYQYIVAESTLINAARWSNIITDDDIDIVLFVSKTEYLNIINNDTVTINKFQSMYEAYPQISHCKIGWTAVLHKCYLYKNHLTINTSLHHYNFSFLIDIHYAYIDYANQSVNGYPYLSNVPLSNILPFKHCLLGHQTVFCPNKAIRFLKSWYDFDKFIYLHDSLIFPPDLEDQDQDKGGIKWQIIESVTWLYNNQYVSLCDGENYYYCFSS